MKVTMETVKDLWKKNHVGGIYLPIKYEGREYVQIEDMDTPSYDGRWGAYWEGCAVKLGDDILHNAVYCNAPVYSIIWVITDSNAEPEDSADWDNPNDIQESGEVNIYNGYVF